MTSFLKHCFGIITLLYLSSGISGCQSYETACQDNKDLRLGQTIWITTDEHVVNISETKKVILPDGTVALPYIGKISIAGLSIKQAERNIQSAYRSSGVFRNAQVRICTQGVAGAPGSAESAKGSLGARVTHEVKSAERSSTGE